MLVSSEETHPTGSQILWQVPSLARPTCPLSFAWLLGDTEVVNGCHRLSTIKCHTTREAAVTLPWSSYQLPALCWNKSWVPPGRFRCLAARPIPEGWLSTCHGLIRTRLQTSQDTSSPSNVRCRKYHPSKGWATLSTGPRAQIKKGQQKSGQEIGMIINIRRKLTTTDRIWNKIEQNKEAKYAFWELWKIFKDWELKSTG